MKCATLTHPASQTNKPGSGVDMLIATYALSTFSVEQKKERSFIGRIQHTLHSHAGKLQEIDPLRLESDLDQLSRFSESRHRRRVADCLMPAVRRATREAETLLHDLEALRRTGSALLFDVRRSLRPAFAHGSIKQWCHSMERYCQNLLQRLAKEEQELLPLARRVMSSADWFMVGSTLLSHDARRTERAPGTAYAQH
jgi:hemerythrin-like domain-containing protein